jgi:hypothetical protein
VIYFATCFFCLNQHNYPDNGRNLLDLFSSNFPDLSVVQAAYGLVQPDNFHPPSTLDYSMPFQCYKQNFNISTKRFSAEDYAVLYNTVGIELSPSQVVPKGEEITTIYSYI